MGLVAVAGGVEKDRRGLYVVEDYLGLTLLAIDGGVDADAYGRDDVPSDVLGRDAQLDKA